MKKSRKVQFIIIPFLFCFLLVLLVGCSGNNAQIEQLKKENTELKSEVAELESSNEILALRIESLDEQVNVWKTRVQEYEEKEEANNIEANTDDNTVLIEGEKNIEKETGVNPLEIIGIEMTPLLPAKITGLGRDGNGYVQFDSWTILDTEIRYYQNEFAVDIEMAGTKHGLNTGHNAYIFYYDKDGYVLDSKVVTLNEFEDDTKFKVKHTLFIPNETTSIEVKGK